MGGLMATSSKRACAICRSAAPRAPGHVAVHSDLYLHRRHSNIVLSQSLWGPWILVRTRLKLVLEKPEEPEIKLPTSTGSSKKQESSRRTSISALLTMPKPLTVWITVNKNSERDGNTRPPDLPLEKPVCRSGSNS